MAMVARARRHPVLHPHRKARALTGGFKRVARTCRATRLTLPTLIPAQLKSPQNRRALLGAVHRPRALCRPPARDPALQDSHTKWYRLLT